jgi:hypothetical protein
MSTDEPFQLVYKVQEPSVGETKSHDANLTFTYQDEKDSDVDDSPATAERPGESSIEMSYMRSDPSDPSTPCNSPCNSRCEPTSDEQDGDSAAMQVARYVLKDIETVAEIPTVPAGYENSDEFLLTQVEIDWHIAVLREMIKMRPIDMIPRDLIVYVYRTLEKPSVSPISGLTFLGLDETEKINVVLTIARGIVEPYWRDYESAMYIQCHRCLDSQARYYIRRMYYDNEARCCVVS